jgi:hypothetical protein
VRIGSGRGCAYACVSGWTVGKGLNQVLAGNAGFFGRLGDAEPHVFSDVDPEEQTGMEYYMLQVSS